MESCKELRENNPYLFNSWRAILYFDEMKILGKTIKKIMEDRLSGNGN